MERGEIIIAIVMAIIAGLGLLYFEIDRRRKREERKTDVEIIHLTPRTFQRHLYFELRNKGPGNVKNIKVTHNNEIGIGDFELAGYEEEIPPGNKSTINLSWNVKKIPTHYEGKVKIKVTYEGILTKWIFWKDKKAHKIGYYIKDGKVTILKDGN